MTASHVAIVILNWNGRGFLEKFLPSVLQTTYKDHELIVADNASTDDSIAFLEKNYPSIRIIRLKENYGFAKGYNEALTQVNADYYMLLNSDVEVEPDWLQPMVQLLDHNKEIAACQPKVLSFDNKQMFEYAGAAGGWIDHYGYPFSKGRIFETCEQDLGQYDQQESIFWATGAALFIRPQVFHDMKGFDEYFFAHMEEIDLCWRIQLAGYTIYSCPSSVVYHVGGGTLPQGNPRKTFLNFRNNHIMLYKNLDWWSKVRVIPYRFCLDGISGWKGLISGNSAYLFAIIKAHFAFLGWLFFHQRKSVFPAVRTGKPRGVLNGNVVWLYFVKKKTRFSEIVRQSL
ncbi:glycosyltransferase family 2 protein [Terrimonas sp. NA20]|uniref:Glycosyltransferase family 2 protein n=1 Tax=Terrimonas ginsenosidimutans TaxID=2908004 RepID=A0ABS9KWT9_9BACT|nr:glycosyltransferase family 2 protein [Terrimonas ginsenosidimutans]MCG2616819.1 glycosyltransferase family 2 protein [Terrimonas ginsenosidimutans]